MPVPAVRVRPINDLDARPDRDYVLYWMIASRRLQANFALQRAVDCAREWGKPLIILEALRCDYPWASDRLHHFVVDGMADHARALAGTPVAYFPFVESSRGDGKGLLAALAGRACLVVTDDFPAFFIPHMIAAAGRTIDARLEAVDANGLLPMRATEKVFLTAFSFRQYLQGCFRDHLQEWPDALTFDDLPNAVIPSAVTERWQPTPPDRLESPGTWLGSLPIDHRVAPVALRGGSRAAHARLRDFLDHKLSRYVEDHSHPDADATSGLSPYLHFGHIGSHEVFAALMTTEGWTSRRLGPGRKGQREGWWGASPNAEAFLDQLITWRELGYNMCAWQPHDYDSFDSLPAWARATLDRHAADPRLSPYTRDQLAAAATHDDVWNAAQRQLTTDGTCHNYLRMLWGKKILEWSPSADEALETMIELMNRLSLDGRNPNSYTGYCWTLGRYDRPWAPERPIFGTIRYMSSDNTVRKLRMKQYLARWTQRRLL
jgi:deoxyribodipyrimidine photo-lyase